MANHCHTGCIVTGTDAEIERFKQTCFITPETRHELIDPESNGIDFVTRPEWKSEMLIYWSIYYFDKGQHHVLVNSRWSPPVKSFERISALFPELTFETTIADEFYNFAYKGNDQGGHR